MEREKQTKVCREFGKGKNVFEVWTVRTFCALPLRKLMTLTHFPTAIFSLTWQLL